MSERLADRLKIACRVAFIAGNVALFWLFHVVRSARHAEDLPFTLTQGVLLIGLAGLALGTSMLGGMYLSFAMGVDVFGLNRISGLPRGKPFEGLDSGEQARLKLAWSHGSLGRGAAAGFKLLLTNRRLLTGSSLTSWYLLEIPLDRIRLVETITRWWGPAALRFHLLDGPRAYRDLTLANEDKRVRLEQALTELGVSVSPGVAGSTS